MGALAQEAAAEAINPLAAYVTITADDRVTVISSQFDMGEGSYHGIATLVLEELGARWDQTDVVGGSGDPRLYGNLAAGGQFQFTGGSTSMASSWDRYRQAGATARAMLVAAAAEAVGRAGGRDRGGRREAHPPDRRQPRLRRARRAGGGDAGAGGGAAEGGRSSGR